MSAKMMLRQFALVSLLSVAACAQGELFIAGGGIDYGGDLIPAFLRRVDVVPKPKLQRAAFLEVITAASSDPARSLSRMLETFSLISMGPVARGKVINDASTDAAKRIDLAQAIWFSGGKQSRIVARLRPESLSSETPKSMMQALNRLLKRGGIIGGSSAGAAIMSDPMIGGGSSKSALFNGVGPKGVRLTQGLGFFPFGTVDQHFLARGRFARLLVAQHHLGTRFGFGIEENSALHVQLGAKPRLVGVGRNAVTILELVSKPKGGPQEELVLCARLSLLGHGDHFDPLSGISSARQGRVSVPPLPASAMRTLKPLPAFGRGSLLRALHRLSRSQETAQVMVDDRIRVKLSADTRTQFACAPHNASDLFVSQVVLRICVQKQQ